MAQYPTSKRMQNDIIRTLHQHKDPMRTHAVAQSIARSDQAVRYGLEALAEDGLVIKLDNSPQEWTVDGASDAPELHHAPHKYDGYKVLVETKEDEDIVTHWNQSRESVAKMIGKLQLKDGIEPKQVANQIGTIAGALAQLAVKLNDVADHPDWLEELLP